MSRVAPLVLAINAGSSSLKFAVHPVHPGADATADRAWLSGQFDGLASGGASLQLRWRGPAGSGDALSLPCDPAQPYAAALHWLRDELPRLRPDCTPWQAVAHRIVHGGDRCVASCRLEADTLRYLASLNPLAPLHQPHNLAGVQAFADAWPDLPQIGCFDTGFHVTLPEVERCLPLPRALAAQGLRRYGFHGLSYRYLTQRLKVLSPTLSTGRWLLAHLGSGASLCAINDASSVATTMGFSALDGLMMGTRSGSIDPGVLLYLLQQGWTTAQLEQLLYKHCGLAGVSGLSSDMRTLRASHEPDAKLAIDLFTRRVIREAGAMVACLNGMDGMVFTGGIGEHDAALRREVAQALSHLGVRLDEAANAAADGSAAACISTAGSAVAVWVIPTDEGRIAAQDAAALI